MKKNDSILPPVLFDIEDENVVLIKRESGYCMFKFTRDAIQYIPMIHPDSALAHYLDIH